MAENYLLEAQPRAIVGKKVKQLRRQGLVPVAIFGPKVQPQNLQVPYRPLQVALMQAGGTRLIDISVDGSTTTVLAREVQRDVLRGDIMYVDFFAVDMASTIRTDVPIHFVGESPAVTNRIGILITGPTMLTIETLPSKLLTQIDVDLSPLVEIGNSIHVRDLNLGEDVVVHNDPGELIAHITQTSAARSEEEEAAEAAAAEGEVSAEVEVIEKGKKEEDEDF